MKYIFRRGSENKEDFNFNWKHFKIAKKFRIVNVLPMLDKISFH